jgi:hypothetical protein
MALFHAEKMDTSASGNDVTSKYSGKLVLIFTSLRLYRQV